MTISSLFIRRPRLAFVVSTVITIAGLIAMTALPVAQFPDIVPPQVRVTATYPGASAQAVEESVAQVIEAQVNGVERMIYMKSTSGGDGSYSLIVSFEVGSNPDLNTVNVNNRVNQAVALLPPEVQRLGVTTKKQSSALLQVVAVYSPKGSRDALFLSNFATITLLDTLRRVPGVGDATLFGALDYSMRVWLNLDRMSSLDITPDDVVKAVQAQNVQAAVGLVGAAPLMEDVGFQLNITTQGRLTTVEEFENIVVRATSEGALVRVKDIARVELGAKTSDQLGRYNGKPAAGIQIYQLPGANALATAKGVRDAIKALEPRFPDDVAYNVMYDTTVFVEATIESVIHTLIEAFVLVAIVVFIFLGNLRATLIPIIAVPVALIGTFAVMLALGFSANTISLLALVLAIGIVVDDAIVVVEAVEHILEHEPNLTVAEATEKAMTQVTGPIIAITLVLLSVFIPTAFIPGIAGQLYSQFAVAVSVSMVISAINALSLSPALCSLILRHRKKPRGVMAWLQNGIDKSRDGYVRLVTPIARRSIIALLLVGGFVVATGGIGSLVPDRLPARRGPGRLHGRAAAARRRLDQPHARRRRGGREDHRRPAVAAEHVHRQRLQPDRRPRPAQPRAGRGRAKTLCRAQGRQAVGVPGAEGTQPRLQPDRLGQRLRLQPAADHGAGQFVGLRVRGPVAGRRLAHRPRRRFPRPDDLGAGSADAQPASTRPLAPRRRRSTSSSTASAPRRWACRSPTSSPRCRRRWAAPIPTTSTCSAAPGR